MGTMTHSWVGAVLVVLALASCARGVCEMTFPDVSNTLDELETYITGVGTTTSELCLNPGTYTSACAEPSVASQSNTEAAITIGTGQDIAIRCLVRVG